MGDQFFFAELVKAKGLGVRAGTLATATEDEFVTAMEQAMECIDKAKQFGEDVQSQPWSVCTK